MDIYICSFRNHLQSEHNLLKNWFEICFRNPNKLTALIQFVLFILYLKSAYVLCMWFLPSFLKHVFNYSKRNMDRKKELRIFTCALFFLNIFQATWNISHSNDFSILIFFGKCDDIFTSERVTSNRI